MEKISKEEELKNWLMRLDELKEKVYEQLEWLGSEAVVSQKSDSCPKELDAVADRLVALQNEMGEYTRESISKQDIEKIKYYSKKQNVGFEDVVNLIVSNNRYLSKDRIEARGIAKFAAEIQAVYDKYYQENGVFPINAMSAESKRSCRNFQNDVSLTEKVQAIVSVYFPELNGMNIAEKDFSIVPQVKTELTEQDIKFISNYFYVFEEDGKIDNCFEISNQKKFIEICRLLSKAGLTLDEFLSKYTELTYTKCYSSKIIPAVKQMVKSYHAKYGTTRSISTIDKYLRNKIEAGQNAIQIYSIRDFLNSLHVENDNDDTNDRVISDSEIKQRTSNLVKKIQLLYPGGVIGDDFILGHVDLYEELKFLSARNGYKSVDEFLALFNIKRNSLHHSKFDERLYLSERDLFNYGFNEADSQVLDDCEFIELDPKDYFGVYNSLIFCREDSSKVHDISKKLGDE